MILNEKGKKLIVETFKNVCVKKIDWQFQKIFEEIELKISEQETSIYEIKGYYTENSNPHLIKFDESHFSN
jgi:hypothetical protein